MRPVSVVDHYQEDADGASSGTLADSKLRLRRLPGLLIRNAVWSPQISAFGRLFHSPTTGSAPVNSMTSRPIELQPQAAVKGRS